MTITFVSTSWAIELDPDLPLLLDAAGRRGIDAEITVWDDPAVDWSAYDAVVVRSCWDYITRREEFLAWAASVPRLHNSHEVLAWNTDKVYLRQIEAAGVPIIETRWDVARRGRPRRPRRMGRQAHDLGRITRHRAVGARPTTSMPTARQLVAAGRASMTQPYISSVDDEGETAMLFFGGEFSHAIRKGQLLHRGEGRAPGPRRPASRSTRARRAMPSSRSPRPRWPLLATSSGSPSRCCTPGSTS